MPQRPSDADQLRAAAAGLTTAAEMLDHNIAIFKGKWQKGSKAWKGEFIERTIAEAVAILPRAAPAPSYEHCFDAALKALERLNSVRFMWNGPIHQAAALLLKATGPEEPASHRAAPAPVQSGTSTAHGGSDDLPSSDRAVAWLVEAIAGPSRWRSVMWPNEKKAIDEYAASPAHKVTPLYAATLPASVREESGAWSATDRRRAFVEGMKWWQYKHGGATAFPSEVDEAEAEAQRRYEEQG